MAKLVQVKTSAGPILIEVSRLESATRQVSVSEDRIVEATETLSEGIDKLVAFNNDFIDTMRKLGKKAKKVELEVGFELTGEGKFFFASATASATFKAKIEFDLTQ
jgi:hypothetical protein